MYTVEKFKDDLLGPLQTNLVSMVLFGSAAIDDTTKRYSDINTLLVVKSDDLSTMKAIAPFVRKWRAQGNPAPLLFSTESLANGRDVFAIEFQDIRSSHRVLAGSDPFVDLTPSPAALRSQLEFELRSKHLALQKSYFDALGNPKRLRDIIAKSLSSFTVLARTILHLAGHSVPMKKADVWSQLCKLMQMDAGAVETIFDIREDKRAGHAADPEALFGAYLALVQRMTKFVDEFSVGK